MLLHKLQEKLLDRVESNSFRKLVVKPGLTDFFSNDYLGLSRSEDLYEEIHQEVLKLGLNRNGSTGSRLLSGNSTYAEELEKYLAFYFRAEKALLFNSGYNANLSILSAIPGKGDTILYDELIHASLKDGARLSLANRFSFKHNDLQDLESKLNRSAGEKFVVVESVYSMDGDTAPLQELVALCERLGAHLIVDEAHGTGIMGKYGEGMCVQEELQTRIFARVYTFGKAMGMHGACIAGSRVLVEYLINFARPFIYTTALPPHALVTIRKSFERCEKLSELRSTLQSRIDFWRECSQLNLAASTFSVNNSPIQVVIIPGNENVRRAQQLLEEGGIDARAILSPTVKEGEERIRICLHVYNTEDEIKRLITILKEVR